MAFTYGFYNYKASDGSPKLYDAEEMSRLFDGIITDGVYAYVGDKFLVSAAGNNANRIIIGSGRAWFNHTWNYNNADYIIIAPSPPTYDKRIDALIIDINTSQRTNRITWKSGAVADEPVKPTLIKSGNHFQYALAYITRTAGQPVIKASDIENAVGTSETPYVTGVLQSISTNQLLAQIEAEFSEYMTKLETDGDTFALKAEGYAVGKANGVEVPSSSPYHNNNSKHFAEEANSHSSDARSYAVAAHDSASQAASSATQATSSANAASNSANQAETARSRAAASESNALSSATNAANSASSASTSATSAANSASSASTSATNAANSASSASTSATNAAASKTSAANSATLSESYAKGGTNTRTGEDTDSALYYKNLAKTYSENAESVVGIGIATTQRAGIVKPDGETIFVDEGGKITSKKPTVKSQSLAANGTSVTFTGIPTSGNNMIDFFITDGANYTAINTATAGQITLTYAASSSTRTVYCRIEEI